MPCRSYLAVLRPMVPLAVLFFVVLSSVVLVACVSMPARLAPLPPTMPDSLEISLQQSNMAFIRTIEVSSGRLVYWERVSPSRPGGPDAESDTPRSVSLGPGDLPILYEALKPYKLHLVRTRYDPLSLGQAGSSSLLIRWPGGRMSLSEGGSTFIRSAHSSAYFGALKAVHDWARSIVAREEASGRADPSAGP